MKGCLRLKIILPKKYGCITMYTYAPFFFIYSVSNICSNVANFPAKRLKKYGAQNTHAPIFLKIINIADKVNIYSGDVFLYSHLLLLNKDID